MTVEELAKVLAGDVRGAFTFVTRVNGVDEARQIRPADVRSAIEAVTQHQSGASSRRGKTTQK